MLADMASKKTGHTAPTPSDIVRIPRALTNRLTRVGEVMGKRAFVVLPYPVVVRAVIERGLDALELELGIRRAPRSKATDSEDEPKGDPE